MVNPLGSTLNAVVQDGQRISAPFVDTYVAGTSARSSHFGQKIVMMSSID
jgi:hypothetical protein